MKIIGYSERGAMNALFYGMAHANDEKAMNEFIRLAGIGKTKGDDNEGPFSDFEIYSEFSLSDFGDPDMIVTAKDCNNKDVVFFIEAKASCGERFDIDKQQDKHNRYMEDGTTYKDGHSSNLFFQLRLKNYFFQLCDSFYKESTDNLEKKHEEISKSINPSNLNQDPNRLLKTRDRYRKIGDNVVVTKIVKLIQECKKEYYIAIIPEEGKTVKTDSYGFTTYTVSWKSIYDHSDLKDYVKETLLFNQNEDQNHRTVSQILNNPVEGDKA